MQGVERSTLPQLEPKEVIILTLMIEHGNNNKKMLADKRCPYTENGLYYDVKRKVRPYFDEYIDGVKENAASILVTGAPVAAQNLVDKVKHQNPNISMDASREILDRIGVSRPKELNQTNVQVNNFIPLLGGDSAKNVISENDSNREDTQTQQED